MCYVEFWGCEWKGCGLEVGVIGIDKGYVFTIVYNGITIHIKCNVDPLVIPIHCVAHKVNLVVKLILST
jgi:hypothetical protein